MYLVYARIGASHRAISDCAIPFRSARSLTWSSPIIPVPKYRASARQTYPPDTLAVGSIAQLSVSVMPVSAGTSSRRNRVRFSVWSGQAG